MGEAIVEEENGDIRCYKEETAGQRGVGFLIKNRIIQLENKKEL